MPITIARVVAIASVVIAGVLIVCAHRRRPELLASEIALSAYFTAPTRAMMTSAYAAIAAALLSTAFVLTTDTRAAALVTAVACCVGAMLLVPVVATTQRNATVIRSEAAKCAHRYAAAASFVAVGVAMTVSACAAIIEANTPVAILGFFGTILVSRVLRNNQNSAHGLWQKFLLVILGLWIVAITITG